MTPAMQLRKHDPENGEVGDCWRACLATIMDLPIEIVPDFTDGGVLFHDYVQRTNAWLAGFGCVLVSIPVVAGDTSSALEFAGSRVINCHWLLGGADADGVDRSVVCRGDKVVWDTSIGQPSPLVRPMSDGWYWANYIGKALP